MVKEVSGLKIDECMHPLPKIDGCSCTRRTRTIKGPAFGYLGLLTSSFYNLKIKSHLFPVTVTVKYVNKEP